eukprot:7858586-Pyramimonas_sp.AAC.1
MQSWSTYVCPASPTTKGGTHGGALLAAQTRYHTHARFMGAKGRQKPIVNGTQRASCVLRLQTVDILLIGAYLWDSIGYKAANRDIMWEIITFARAMRMPYILEGDFNMDPSSIEGASILSHMNGTIVVPGIPYINA